MISADHLLTAGKTYCCYLRAPAGGSCYIDDACFDFYLRRLLVRSAAYRVRMHAYCLLAQEVFLLVTPATPFAVSDWLKSVNACYGDYFSERYHRPARVYPKRRATSVINGTAAFLDCQKFLETEGSRRNGLTHPGAYHWSSYTRHAFVCDRKSNPADNSAALSPHRATRDFLQSGATRLHNYREFIAQEFSLPYLHYLSVCLRHGRALGPRPGARKSAGLVAA